MEKLYLSLFLLVIAFACTSVSQQLQEDPPYYIHQCRRDDPNINQCLTYAANHIAMHFRRGITELGVTEVEPIFIDEINLALGSGPDGYRAIFKNIEAFGVSNLTVTAVRSDLDTLQFQLSFYIPKISARAYYRSTGVLIMVQASGGGEYWGEYEGVRAKIYFQAKLKDIDYEQYLELQDLKMDFSVKRLQMGVKNVHNGNAILEAALNLFINSNAQDLLKEMKPSIKKKLLVNLRQFIENLFSRIPYSSWIID
uniref:Protein takeout n=1 Tax=Clastoptera arizonana TaxID=38151 RepID=A0A1B6E0H0_9HEMI